MQSSTGVATGYLLWTPKGNWQHGLVSHTLSLKYPYTGSISTANNTSVKPFISLKQKIYIRCSCAKLIKLKTTALNLTDYTLHQYHQTFLIKLSGRCKLQLTTALASFFILQVVNNDYRFDSLRLALSKWYK